MGTLKDVFDFERINFGNIWDQIEDDPWRVLVGSVDPFSTELWNQITGEEYEPMVNMLGGPMGSGWTGLGENGGVYDLAKEQGVDTKWSEQSHDVAEIIAAIYGGSALGDLFGGMFSGGEGAVSGGGEAAASGDGLMGMGDITQGWDAANLSNLEQTLGGMEAPSMGGGGFFDQLMQNMQQNPPQMGGQGGGSEAPQRKSLSVDPATGIEFMQQEVSQPDAPRPLYENADQKRRRLIAEALGYG
jgi:hypothetical protein